MSQKAPMPLLWRQHMLTSLHTFESTLFAIITVSITVGWNQKSSCTCNEDSLALSPGHALKKQGIVDSILAACATNYHIRLLVVFDWSYKDRKQMDCPMNLAFSPAPVFARTSLLLPHPSSTEKLLANLNTSKSTSKVPQQQSACPARLILSLFSLLNRYIDSAICKVR